MIFSTLLLNLIGFYEISDEDRLEINNFKQNSLYSEDYRKCALKHHSVKLFGEPINCINDTFLLVAMEIMNVEHSDSSSPDLTHLIRKMKANDELIKEIEITSNKQGQVIKIEAKISNNADTEVMRAISRKINAKYGQPDAHPPSHNMPMWGWKTNDGFEIRLFKDTYQNSNIFSITHRDAYSTLRDIKDKEFKNEFDWKS